MILILAFTLPVFATGTVTIGAVTNDFVTYTDTTEFYIESQISDDVLAGITLTVNDLVFGDPTATVDATLDFTLREGETAQLGAGVDITAGTYYVKGKILNYSLSDNMHFNAKAKYNFGGTYWAVANVVMNGERVDLIVEARVDSDGTVPYSAEAQLTFGLSKNVDVIVGYEWNNWSDSINSWDAMSIVGSENTFYGKVIIRF